MKKLIILSVLTILLSSSCERLFNKCRTCPDPSRKAYLEKEKAARKNRK